MIDASLNMNTHVLRRRFRRIALSAVAIAMICALVVVGSAVVSRRAGASAVRPHALGGGIAIVMAATGVTGEGAGGTISVNNLQFGAHKTASGKAKVNDITITKVVDKASPSFFKNCVAGSHYKTVTLSIRRAGVGIPSDSMTISLGTVFVTGIQWSFDAPSGTAPTETLTLSFVTVRVTYVPTPTIG
jgi:type VI secretion system secreted protein Hcp